MEIWDAGRGWTTGVDGTDLVARTPACAEPAILGMQGASRCLLAGARAIASFLRGRTAAHEGPARNQGPADCWRSNTQPASLELDVRD